MENKDIAKGIILLIIIVLVASGVYLWQKSALEGVKSEMGQQISELQAQFEQEKREKEDLQRQINELLEQREGCLESDPKLWSWEIDELKKKGLIDPVNDLKSDLMQHSELIPYEGILGGTMGFYSKDNIWILTKKWVLAWFEDGHIGGYMLLEYTVSDGGEITWKVIDSYLD
ncbi:hypothetical protein KJA15_00380 [Patescibacteria group bacterium]|nr:hypothetical protein [Patescibacteria group bacterium]